MYELCSLDEEDESSLHHEFSKAITVLILMHFVFLLLLIIWWIKETHSKFPTIASWQILLTKPKLTENLLNFYLKVPNWEVKCIENTTRPILNRSLQNYLKTYQKTRKTVKVRDHTHKYDLNKETVNFLRKIDYATLRDKAFVKIWANKDIIFLTRDGHVRKYPKSELATELKKPLKGSYLAALPPTEQKRMIFIDFMGQDFINVRKVLVKKQKLKTFHDLFKSLWSFFKNLSATCSRMDIFFELYIKKTVSNHTSVTVAVKLKT